MDHTPKRRWRRRLRYAGLGYLAFYFVTCDMGPIWAPRIEGRVVDARTGEPVAGAGVFSGYTYQSRYEWDVRWTTTDASGRFAIPGHFAVLFGRFTFLADVDGPHVSVMHPAYGIHDKGHWHARQVRFRELEFRLEPDLTWRQAFGIGSGAAICGDWPYEVCDAACEIMWGKLCDFPRLHP